MRPEQGLRVAERLRNEQGLRVTERLRPEQGLRVTELLFKNDSTEISHPHCFATSKHRIFATPKLRNLETPSLPLQRLQHAYHVFADVILHRRKGVGVGCYVEVDGAAEEMVDTIRYEKLGGAERLFFAKSAYNESI